MRRSGVSQYDIDQMWFRVKNRIHPPQPKQLPLDSPPPPGNARRNLKNDFNVACTTKKGMEILFRQEVFPPPPSSSRVPLMFDYNVDFRDLTSAGNYIMNDIKYCMNIMNDMKYCMNVIKIF